ncbi:MAG: extracellular solute-binding protein, partial [Eubacteriales bacterium]
SMNDYIADWDGIGDYYDATLSAGSIGDDLYGIATYADARVFAYNTELFTEVGIEEVPTNWEELYEAHAALVKKDDAGNVIQTGLALSTSGTNINQYLQIFSIQNGLAGLVDAGTDEILFNTDEAIEAAEFLASLSDLGLILWDSMSFDTNPFVAGTAAMAIINETEFNLANEALGGVLEIAPMFGNVETATFSGSHMFHMSAQTAHPDATWALIEYMTSAESLEIWMDATGAAPVRASLEEHYLELSPTYGEFFMEAVSVGHPASLVTYNSAMVTILDSTMEEIFYGVSEPADALNAAAIEVQAEIDNQ